MRIESFMALDKNDYRNALIIQIDGKTVFQAIDGEPEDNSLSRNFNDCYGVVSLLEQAYQAGRDFSNLAGEEELVVVNHKLSWDELWEL